MVAASTQKKALARAVRNRSTSPAPGERQDDSQDRGGYSE
jgi:hypothetical protein